MKQFEQIQQNIQYDESIARLRRAYELAVKRLVNSRVKVGKELAKIKKFDEKLDTLLQK